MSRLEGFELRAGLGFTDGWASIGARFSGLRTGEDCALPPSRLLFLCEVSGILPEPLDMSAPPWTPEFYKQNCKYFVYLEKLKACTLDDHCQIILLNSIDIKKLMGSA